jgi:anti-anti-sigma factor
VVAPHAGVTETRLSLTGELDLASAPLLAWILGVTLDGRPARVVLDLRRLRLIDVRCAGTLADAAARCADWNGTLVARRPQPAVLRVFQLCGLSDLLHPRARVSQPRKEADA